MDGKKSTLVRRINYVSHNANLEGNEGVIAYEWDSIG